jgi:ATP-dependent Lon protease
LKPEEREKLKKVLEGVNAAYITESGADALAAELHAMYPWMAEATETVWLNLRRTAFEGVPARINPILLDGPPGIGKSAWSRSLAAAMNAPSLSIDAVAASTGFAIAGTERGWSSAQPGRPVQAILQHHHAGPVIVVDEVCKAASSNSTGGTRHNIQDSLLGFLEPVSAAHWECPFYRVRFDMSAISWILTSNDFAKIPEPLLTRCAVIRCGHLSNGELLTAGKSMAEKADLSAPSYDAAVTAIERTITAIRRPMNLRDVQRIVKRGASLQSKPMHN